MRNSGNTFYLGKESGIFLHLMMQLTYLNIWAKQASSKWRKQRRTETNKKSDKISITVRLERGMTLRNFMFLNCRPFLGRLAFRLWPEFQFRSARATSAVVSAWFPLSGSQSARCPRVRGFLPGPLHSGPNLLSGTAWQLSGCHLSQFYIMLAVPPASELR